MAVSGTLSAAQIVVVGEVYLDHIFSGFQRWPAPGEETFAQHYRRELGGGTLITACALARLGCKVRAIGAIGAPDRAVFAQRLGEFGIAADGLIDSPAGTGVTTSVSLHEDRSFFTYAGANAELGSMLLREELIAALSTAAHVHFAMPLPAALAEVLLPRLERAGCTTSLDVGFNPAWLADPANHATCRAVSWFLPNQTEAARMGCGDGPQACLEWAHALGLRRCVIKLGAAGAMCIDDTGARRIAASPQRRCRCATPPAPAMPSMPVSSPHGGTASRWMLACSRPAAPVRHVAARSARWTVFSCYLPQPRTCHEQFYR